MSSQTLIIAGMHRSGTSLVTNWLHRCGLEVGESLLEEGIGNPEGHFEDTEFLKMHEEILKDNGLPADGLVAGKEIRISDYEYEKLRAIIKVKNDKFDQWGWKEPRTCLFLHMYRELLPDAKYLVIARDYPSVTNSLLKRDFAYDDEGYKKRSFVSRLKWSLYKKNRRKNEIYHNKAEEYLRVWIDYNEHILSFLERTPAEQYLVINYSLLGENDCSIFAFLSNKWHFKLKYYAFKKVFKQNLISTPPDLSPYIKDAALVSRATSIEEQFNKYMLKLAPAK